jgi:alpha-D-xyloside xylohydrolase
MILCRAAYLGAQRNGCLFWSSDVDDGKRCSARSLPGSTPRASGMAYWSSDTGGWQYPGGAARRRRRRWSIRPARRRWRLAADYPELFVRWFQYNTFTPTLRIHGQRRARRCGQQGGRGDPGRQSLRLRYALLPYLRRAPCL